MSINTPKYPNIIVRLVGEDGSAFGILAKVRRALGKNKISKEDIDDFMTEAMSGDYDNLLQTCMKWVDVK